MKYDLTKHALIEDNGDLVATFNSCIPSGRAFKILDDLNEAKILEHVKDQLDFSEESREELKKENEIAEKEIWDLEEKIEKLDDRLQSIITMLEDSSDNYSKEELIKEVIDICSAPL